jgi:hypothetical protein
MVCKFLKNGDDDYSKITKKYPNRLVKYASTKQKLSKQCFIFGIIYYASTFGDVNGLFYLLM